MNKILLIGESCVDKVVETTHSRNSPEDNTIPVLKVDKESTTFGMVDIVSSHLKTSHETLSNKWNKIEKVRVFKGKEQIARLDYDNNVSLTDEQTIELKNYLKEVNSVVISDYGKGFLSYNVIDMICSSGKRIYLDPHPNNDIEQYKNLFVIKLNDKELETFTGIKDDLKRACQLLKGMTNAVHVFVTLGSKGIYHYDGEQHYSASQVKTVKNVSGAGDVVMASIVDDIENSLPIHVVLMNAMEKAAIHVEQRPIERLWPKYVR